MPTVVGVRLRFSKTLWFAPAGNEPAEGDTVIVETERGTELGSVVQAPHDVADDALPAPLKPIVRVAGEDDLAHAQELAAKEREAMPVFRDLVGDYKLDMKPVDVEYLFDGDKIIFYFSADERVDFRDLVRDLASRFHARIDMRQVGVRDEARMVGGVGHCGQLLCCVRFGGEFQPVSIRMAKEQDLPLNPLKISGLCGRLMCCLRYEYDAYKDYKSRAPKRGAVVETPSGLAKVTDLNTPKETVSMRFEDGTRVTVPLSGMACAKGSGCPCSVTREALEAAMGPSSMVATMPEVMPRVAEEEPKPKPVQSEGNVRKRRRRTKPAPDGEGSKTAEQPEAQPKAESAPDAPAADKPARSTRRRRRRKPSGGAGGS